MIHLWASRVMKGPLEIVFITKYFTRKIKEFTQESLSSRCKHLETKSILA